MSDALTPKEAAFLDAYQAHFGMLTENDGRPYVLSWVGQSGVDIGALRKALEEIAEKTTNRDTGRVPKPRITYIKKVYYTIVGKAPNDGRLAAPCAKCNGYGRVHIVIGGDSAGSARIMLRNPRHFAYMTVSTIPCLCTRGSAINDKQGRRVDQKPGDDSHSWPRAKLEGIHRDCAFPFGMDADKFLDDCRRQPLQDAPRGEDMTLAAEGSF